MIQHGKHCVRVTLTRSGDLSGAGHIVGDRSLLSFTEAKIAEAFSAAPNCVDSISVCWDDRGARTHAHVLSSRALSDDESKSISNTLGRKLQVRVTA